MNFLELAKSRFSVRKFSERPVDDDLLKTILETGRVAPTAKNLQPQRIFVLKTKEALEKIRQITTMTYNAPVVLLVCADVDVAWVNPINQHNAAEMDCSIVGTHMMLQAVESGLGTLWACWYDTEAIKKAFEITSPIELYCILALGYPAGDCLPNRRHGERKVLEETVFYR
jgi:nitroreductase